MKSKLFRQGSTSLCILAISVLVLAVTMLNGAWYLENNASESTAEIAHAIHLIAFTLMLTWMPLMIFAFLSDSMVDKKRGHLEEKIVTKLLDPFGKLLWERPTIPIGVISLILIGISVASNPASIQEGFITDLGTSDLGFLVTMMCVVMVIATVIQILFKDTPATKTPKL